MIINTRKNDWNYFGTPDYIVRTNKKGVYQVLTSPNDQWEKYNNSKLHESLYKDGFSFKSEGEAKKFLDEIQKQKKTLLPQKTTFLKSNSLYLPGFIWRAASTQLLRKSALTALLFKILKK